MTEELPPTPDGQERPSAEGQCSCTQDPFANLPPELRPSLGKRKTDLREARCPACGLDYWTNRDTDLCIDCETKRR